jgi:cephalosporin-C deacetylase-like acetyl esterase
MTPLRLSVAALLVVAARARAQQLVATPYATTGIYRAGETVGWTIGVALGQQASPGSYSYTVKENGRRPIKSGTLDLAGGPAKIETTLNEPGMIRVEIRPPAGTQHFGDVHTGGDGVVALAAAVDPTKIQPVVARPVDFDDFWKSKIAMLDRVPMNAVVAPGASGRAGVEYATFRLDNVGGAHVYGQMAWPTRAGKFPALVIYQYARPPYPLEKPWVTDRAAEGWLAINVEPHDVPSDMPQVFYDALPQMLKSYQTINDSDRDHSYFLQMYLGDYRAIEYLATRPDWDGKTLVATGISMGGQQSLVMAALSPRVTGVVVNVPAGADASAALHQRTAGYPFWDSQNPRVMETAPYFDVVNFASRIKAPSMLAMGFIDDVAPAIGIWTAFNQIAGSKEAVPMIDSPHNHQATAQQLMPWTVRSGAWLKAFLHDEPPPIAKPER